MTSYLRKAAQAMGLSPTDEEVKNRERARQIDEIMSKPLEKSYGALYKSLREPSISLFSKSSREERLGLIKSLTSILSQYPKGGTYQGYISLTDLKARQREFIELKAEIEKIDHISAYLGHASEAFLPYDKQFAKFLVNRTFVTDDNATEVRAYIKLFNVYGREAIKRYAGREQLVKDVYQACESFLSILKAEVKRNEEIEQQNKDDQLNAFVDKNPRAESILSDYPSLFQYVFHEGLPYRVTKGLAIPIRKEFALFEENLAKERSDLDKKIQNLQAEFSERTRERYTLASSLTHRIKEIGEYK